MKLVDMIEAHFTVDRWGILQYFLNGMVDPQQGIIAPLELLDQGYGDDLLQIRFLSSVLEGRGIADVDQQIIRCPVSLQIDDAKPITAPLPGIRWTDEDGQHDFSPCPFLRFSQGQPDLKFEVDTERNVPRFVEEVSKMCQWDTLRSGGMTTNACIYSPSFYPNTLHWDPETETMMLAVLGTQRQPGIGNFYFELSRYSWEGNTLVVRRRAGVKAQISFAHLYNVQLAIGGLEPMVGLKYLVEKKWTDAIPDASMNIRSGNEEMLEKYAPVFVQLFQSVMSFPDQQHKTLFKKIHAANKKLSP